MSNKKFLNNLGWLIVFIIIIINLILLIKIKNNQLTEMPLKSINSTKPVLVLILDEFECVSCVKKLLFLNDIFSSLNSDGRVDMTAIILSKNKTDSKSIAKAFIFPVIISNDFNVMKRLNLNHTPVIVGLSKDHKIVYSELIPFGTTLTEDYIRKGVLDRLYYSLEL